MWPWVTKLNVAGSTTMPGEDRDEEPHPLDEERHRQPRRGRQTSVARVQSPSSTGMCRTRAADDEQSRTARRASPAARAAAADPRRAAMSSENMPGASAPTRRRSSFDEAGLPALADAAARAQPDLALQQPPGVVGRALSRRRVQLPRREPRSAAPAGYPEDGEDNAAMTAMPDQRRHEVADRRVLVVAEAVAVEQRRRES